jgi:hypothetical protein
MVTPRLMLERTLAGFDANTDEHDQELLATAHRTVREILEDAELTLWEFEAAGWSAPDDDSCVAYAARLLLCSERHEELIRAPSIVQEIVLRAAVDSDEATPA